ncbi:MAG: exodeoxyribonuclease VII small subunit, partial [bacterium]
ERLEEIVNSLESESSGLESSLKLFEEGVKLSKGLGDKLDEVKRKVEVLKKDAEGRLKTRPLDDAEAP